MKSVSTYVVIAFILLVFEQKAHAQLFDRNPTSLLDTVRVKANRFIFIDDSAYYVQNDTLIVLSDTVEFFIKKNTMEQSDEFYKNVEQKMSKRKVSAMMYDLMFKTESAKPLNEVSSEQRFIPFQNVVIREIHYKSLEVFGSHMNDTARIDQNKWIKPLNDIHVHTMPWIIRKNLLFKEGDQINPEAMVESERLLRRLNYIKDARILIGEPVGGKKSDVAVVTKDVFPYNFLLSPNNSNDARFGLSTINIGGTGHEFEYNYIDDGGSEFYYRVRNIEGSFIDSELNYANHFRKKGHGIFLNKQFLTQETKYAGGGTYSFYQHGEYLYEPVADTTTTYDFKQRTADIWVGRAFKTSIQSKLLGLKGQANTVAAARIEIFNFYDRPIVSADTNYRYQDKANILLSFGLNSRIYYKDKFILQYGRTEDIPTGTAMGVVAGYQIGEFKDRVYVGFNYARGEYLKNIGYVNAIFSFGTYVSLQGVDDGTFKVGLDYFTKLYSINHYKFRQFVTIGFTQTYKPREEAIFYSQSDLGIRGVKGYYLRATAKFNARFESLLFTPVNIIGFKLATFIFLDYTATANSRNSYFDVDHFMGTGFGVRLRNDNLAFSTIQLRLGYYPSTPINANNEIFNFSTSTQIQVRDFDFKAPEIVPFH